MATALPLTAPAGQGLSPVPAAPAPTALEKPPAPELLPEEETGLIAPGSPVARLPVELDVSVAVADFRVRNLLALEPGQVIESQWGQGQDLPLACGEVRLAWSEFEVVDSQLAVRLTRLV
jgi:flagellar motor switch protein FliN/FliY